MSRNLDTLVRRVREELRAEGPDGAGISDFLVKVAINNALADLSEIFTIRDHVEFDVEEEEDEPKRDYNLRSVVGDGVELENIIRVTYGDRSLKYMTLDEFLEIDDITDGELRAWTLWGNKIFFIGALEEDYEKFSMYISRGPQQLTGPDDIPETPYYADEAIVQYAISAAYRESRDYDRANYHYRLYLLSKESLLRRAVPQTQRERQPHMRDSYWGVVEEKSGISRSDTNPGGRVD